MDVPPPPVAPRSFGGAPSAQPGETPPPLAPRSDDRPPVGSTSGLGDLAARMSALESSVDELGRRIDAMAASIEPSIRDAVGSELANVAGEMRHTVSELGRLIVRDLGKLTQVLGRHREAIVAELKPGRSGGAGVAAAPTFAPTPEPDPSAPDPALPPVVTAGTDTAPGTDEPDDDSAERRRRRTLRGRRNA